MIITRLYVIVIATLRDQTPHLISIKLWICYRCACDCHLGDGDVLKGMVRGGDEGVVSRCSVVSVEGSGVRGVACGKAKGHVGCGGWVLR